MWVVYLAVPLGSALMCYRFLQVAVGYVGTERMSGHAHGVAEEPR